MLKRIIFGISQPLLMANMLALLLGLGSVMSIVKTVTALTTPVVSVEPETTDWTGKPLNGTFMVSVNVNSPDIFIWLGQIGISFNASVLECVSFGKGSAIDPTWLWMAGTVRNDLGYVTTSTWSCITGQEPGWVGNGAFIVYTFRVKSLGNYATPRKCATECERWRCSSYFTNNS